MEKSIIQINEEQLREILSNAVTSVLNEITHRMATIPAASNMNSNDELARGNDIETFPNGKQKSIRNKRDRAGKMSYKVLTQGIFDNVGENIMLYFGRTEEDFTTSNVDFYFKELRLLTPNRFVIEGYAKMTRSPISVGKTKPRKIQIDYRFDQQQFYEAVYCANGTVRDMKPLKLDYAGALGKQNIETAKSLIQFLTMCLYSIEDNQTDILNKGAIQGNTINPITGRK